MTSYEQREKINKLDNTIHKRLGKKANVLWFELKQDLFLADAIRKHISLISTTPKVEKEPNGNYVMNIFYDVYEKKMDEEIIRMIEMWLLKNIDKDRLREWINK